MVDMPDEDLPDLASMFAQPASSAAVRRQSPRKAKQLHFSTVEGESNSNVSVTSKQTRLSPRKPKIPNTVQETSNAKAPVFLLSNIPKLSRYGSGTEVSASSSNGLARSPPQRSISLIHVDSLLLPLSKVCLDGDPKQPEFGSTGLAASKSTNLSGSSSSKQPGAQMRTVAATATRKFVLSEAACADDFENSLIDDEEDEDTDLSGFIVDDDVEPSVHESSSDTEGDTRAKRKRSASPRKRRLQQGPKHRNNARRTSVDAESKKMSKSDDFLSTAFRILEIGTKHNVRPSQEIEVVDLTSSPVKTHDEKSIANTDRQGLFGRSSQAERLGNSTNVFDDFDDILRFSPPNSLAPGSTKPKIVGTTPQDEPIEDDTDNMHQKKRFATPPTTPPRSPSKLKSPSKLPSPSKRAAQVPRSPHRQSLDGFWDLEVVNAWHDTYSPKKAPVTSPRKNRFLEWLNSGDEDDEMPTGLLNDSSDSLPSPCSSPRKSRSPRRSPEKVEKQRVLVEKRAAKAKKQDFESRKEQLAIALMADLDKNITSSRVSVLSSSTGGVQIIWSKTLRSTAGRANWRRTVIKASGSPVKDLSVPEGSKVQHYASIELATKVIDCETRLVNTLAHEYCHLANFMVSNVRDQPHGASFKAWATKVTKYLRAHDNPMYRGVEVTTKHSYTIDHKYLWACAGREALDFQRNVPDPEDGCGAEYGRHSKSIDPDKHRCGRCKGALIQVRPKPRKVDSERSSLQKALFQKKSPVETVTKAIEIVDLSN